MSAIVNDTSILAIDIPIARDTIDVNSYLWPLAIQFNFHPISFVDDSWFLSLQNGQLMRELRECKRSQYWASRYLLEQHGLQNSFDFDFYEKPKRLLLLDNTTSVELIRMAGVLLNAQVIRSQLNNRIIKAIRSAIGINVYSFAVKKASFYLREPPSFALDPDSVGGIPWEKESLREEEITRYFDWCGLRLWGAAIGGYHHSSTSRALWKLPYDHQDPVKQGFVLAGDPQRCRLAQRIFLKLIKEIDTSCSPLFD